MTKLSIRQAQAELPHLVGDALHGKEPCFIQQDGKTVAVLVSVKAWRGRQGRTSESANGNRESRLRAYEAKLKQLGADYWLPAPEQQRLKELVEKNDSIDSLSPRERRELRSLLKRHEQLMIKRAAAIQAVR